MRIIPSAVLKDAAAASERYERADAAMRRGWPEPPDEVIREWNEARRVAEVTSQVVLSCGR